MAHATSASKIDKIIIRNWIIIICIGMVIYAALQLLSITKEEALAYRAEHCPISDFNPEGLVPGSQVTLKATNDVVFGQVVKVPAYRRHISGSVLQKSLLCSMNPRDFSVRIGSHGIAHEGGNWSTAKPEVLPLRDMQHFELTSISNP